MRSPITKLAVAAVIAVAGIAGIVMWTGTGSGIALADVLIQVQQATAYMYQMTATITGKGPTGLDMNQNMQTTVVISQDHGMKMTMSMPDPNGRTTPGSETYMLHQEKAMISLMPATKHYMRMELDDTMAQRARQQSYDPSAMLQQILNSKYESLGRSKIDGLNVEGFRTTDPNYLAGMATGMDMRIWVDVKTQFPVRMEMDMQMGEMQIHAVVHDFQWNYPVDAETFNPVIPADYTALPNMKMPAMNEESAIAGLKLLADRSGRYPEKLDLMSLMSELTKTPDANGSSRTDDQATLRKRIESGVPKEELLKEITATTTKRTLDAMMPVQSLGLFYMTLVQEMKDPAYHGNVVTPQDDTQVLLRWKVSDDQYRVIFGNLHAETVNAATLAELEKSLPK